MNAQLMLVEDYIKTPPTVPHKVFIGQQEVTLGKVDGVYVDAHFPEGVGCIYTYQKVAVAFCDGEVDYEKDVKPLYYQ